MAILALDHVQLAMPAGEEDRARLFYMDVLGMDEVAKPANLARRGGVWFQLGKIKIHLGVAKTFSPATKAHPAFLVDSLAAMIRRLEEAGFPPAQDEPLEGYIRTYASDPFGNRIEFMQKLTP